MRFTRFQKNARRVFLTFALLIAFGLCAGRVFAETLTSEDIVARLQKRYDSISTIEAVFEQETTLGSLNQRRRAEGKVYFKKPGRMRWDYIKPEEQIIVTDGETLWIHMVKEKRAYRYDARGYLRSQLTMNFFLGQGDFERDFVIARSPENKKTQEEFYVLNLIPRFTHPQVSEIRLWISKDTFLIEKLLSKDHLSNVTLLRFKGQRINRSLNDELFAFSPPEGSEVIGE